jgi:CDP-diacylglycerol--glycerol-3-phosphate 3-phosphatidyltransferase
MVMAHWLTFSRPLLAAAFCVCLAALGRGGKLSLGAAAVLVLLGIVEELTDVFDGMVARRYGVASELGGILDPLADSLARLAIYFALALAGWVTVAVPLVMVARDIIVAYTRIVQARTGGHTSARLAGKIKAVIQGVGIPVLVALVWLGGVWRQDAVLWTRWVVAAIIMAGTAWSSVQYVQGAWPGLKQMAVPKPPRAQGN